MDTHVDALPEIEELTAEEGRTLLNGLTRDRLGISVEEFLRRLAAGEYDGTDDEEVLRLKMLAPFAE